MGQTLTEKILSNKVGKSVKTKSDQQNEIIKFRIIHNTQDAKNVGFVA